MIAGVHLLGLACVALLIVPALRDGPSPPGPPPDNGSDDGRGNDRRRPTGPSRGPGAASRCRTPCPRACASANRRDSPICSRPCSAGLRGSPPAGPFGAEDQLGGARCGF